MLYNYCPFSLFIKLFLSSLLMHFGMHLFLIFILVWFLQLNVLNVNELNNIFTIVFGQRN